jgi:hypothetical protein
MQLSEHFTLAEAIRSETAKRRGIGNMPPPDILENMKIAADGMEQVREEAGNRPVIVSSWYRSLALNRAIGGSKTSDHTRGWAIDFTIPSFGSPFDVADMIERSDIRYDQLILEKNRWVHISFSPKMRLQTLTLPPEGGGYIAGLHP